MLSMHFFQYYNFTYIISSYTVAFNIFQNKQILSSRGFELLYGNQTLVKISPIDVYFTHVMVLTFHKNIQEDFLKKLYLHNRFIHSVFTCKKLIAIMKYNCIKFMYF